MLRLYLSRNAHSGRTFTVLASRTIKVTSNHFVQELYIFQLPVKSKIHFQNQNLSQTSSHKNHRNQALRPKLTLLIKQGSVAFVSLNLAGRVGRAGNGTRITGSITWLHFGLMRSARRVGLKGQLGYGGALIGACLLIKYIVQVTENNVVVGGSVN